MIMELIQLGAERTKTVLILMSDTGGGHRASAEAIKAAFKIEFGDEYKVYVTDLWKEHTPWPFNQIPKSYNFLVKHETLWKVAFHGSIPRCIHCPHLAATSALIARNRTDDKRLAIATVRLNAMGRCADSGNQGLSHIGSSSNNGSLIDKTKKKGLLLVQQNMLHFIEATFQTFDA
eukprot:Gb_01081 [translate_table: standard]